MRPIFLITVLALCIIACQKEVSTEFNENNNQANDSTGIEAIYIHYESEGNTYYQDSIIMRYYANRTDEVHYYSPVDSIIRSYHFDAAGKLTEIACTGVVPDLTGSGSQATNLKFLYDAAGELSRIDAEYANDPPTVIWVGFSQQGGKYIAIMYDTAASQSDKKIIYFRLNSKRYLEQDSTIYTGSSNGFTVAFNYSYDGNDNVTQLISRGYNNGNIASLHITDYTRQDVDNPYIPIRQKSYSNLANWLPFTNFFSFISFSPFNMEPPNNLVNSYKTDEYIYLVTIQHYENTWQSVFEMQNDKLIKRVSTLGRTGSEPWTLTERFYHK